ncbi:MAG: aldehyde dehydrogenase [Oligoflexia bacterium]|nr:aldehyde dehydrogenase [Oligoflexia bacterium]
MKEILNYINGEFCPPSDGSFLENENPATGKVYSKVANSNSEDALKAIESAHLAFPSWKATPVKERVKVIRKVANLIKEKEALLAKAESIDNGKPLSVASTVDIPRASQNFEYFCDAITQYSGDAFPMDDTAINYVKREALGAVVCISPWNLPLYLLTWKIAPALLVGNTVIAKPSEVTPMTAFMLSEIFEEAGLPKGVINILHGEGARIGETLANDERVKAISFTGSTATGKVLNQLAAPNFKKVSLEMGGKNPNIVFEDCDYKQALTHAGLAAFANQGQICLCGSRLFVHESIYEQFKNDLVAKASKLIPGDPLNEKTRQGAVVSKAHYEKVLSYIELAKELGGKVLCGGEAHHPDGENKDGYFIKPTLIENLDPYCRVNQEEIFGPVATITPFKDEEEVITWANSTPYGLSASIWTQDITKAHRVSDQIQSGIVWINTWMLRDLRTPFGGMKASGVGREGGYNAFNFFTETKNVCIKY